jgi:hypothetical protein
MHTMAVICTRGVWVMNGVMIRGESQPRIWGFRLQTIQAPSRIEEQVLRVLYLIVRVTFLLPTSAHSCPLRVRVAFGAWVPRRLTPIEAGPGELIRTS